jgi:bis(5'-nucleosyl)-tetraphosphatase (symmetrical)
MALYLIGDIQGCDEPLQRLLEAVAFSPSRDTAFLLGDLVNRGPASDAVLRRLMGYGAAARCLLGNHDLHLLAVDAGVRSTTRGDTLDAVLHAPDRAALMYWLRHQRLAMLESVGDKQLLMVHAGVLPVWSASKTIALAAEVEVVLQSSDVSHLLKSMYGSTPTAWNDTLSGADRSRVIVNALTRLRFCTASGAMEFTTKDSANAAPPGYMPWFDVPARQTADISVAFGHWSTLGWLGRPDVLAMDTGCLWGGCLSALRIEAGKPGQPWNTELIQVKCAQTQRPDAKPTAP